MAGTGISLSNLRPNFEIAKKLTELQEKEDAPVEVYGGV